jgi:predicted RNA-binding Zn-ribbon protein involved in translation (DUF1610 family)
MSMHASEVTPEAIQRANELYWHSDRSVNQIAEDLDLSKGALYGVIEPQLSGLGCPLCGDEVVYANRTAKDRELLGCPTCDWDGSPDEAVQVSARRRKPHAVSVRSLNALGGGPHPVDAEMDGALPPPPFHTEPDENRSGWSAAGCRRGPGSRALGAPPLSSVSLPGTATATPPGAWA